MSTRLISTSTITTIPFCAFLRVFIVWEISHTSILYFCLSHSSIVPLIFQDPAISLLAASISLESDNLKSLNSKNIVVLVLYQTVESCDCVILEINTLQEQ